MRIKELMKRLEDVEEGLQILKEDNQTISREIEYLKSRSEEQLLKRIAKQVIEEAEMSDMPFEDMWERIGNHFCDRYESKIAEMTEETQRQLAMVCLARMELITQSTISKLEKFSNEAIEIIKNKEIKKNE